MANNRDVQLTIRARDQASKAIESVAEALQVLEGAGAASGAGVAALTKSLATLESANKRLASSAETLTRNLEKQQAAAASDAALLEQRKARVAELTAELKRLQAEVQKAAKGPTRDGLTENIKNLRVELRKAEADVRKLPQSITGNNEAAARSAEALRELSEQQARVADASARATAQIELQNRALQRQAVETAKADRAAAAQRFFNNRFAPGLDRPRNTIQEQRDIGAVLRVAEARDREQRAAAQTAELEKQRAEQQRLTELANRYNDEILGISKEYNKVKAEIAEIRDLQTRGLIAEAEANRLIGQRQKALREIRDRNTGKAAAAAEEAAAIEEEARALQRLRAQINPVAVAEARVSEEVQKLIRWHRQGKITLDEARQALALYRVELEKVRGQESRPPGQPGPFDSRGRPTLFGLKPYELQNLGFQVNDIVTQLASGTSLTQTLAQQMGQIIQILPGVGTRILAFLTSPILLAGAALAGVFIAGLVRAGNEAERLRNVQAIIASIGNAAGTSASQVNQAAADLDRFGLSAEDAIAAIRTFTRAGLNPERFVQFGTAARDMALVLGKDVPDAAKLLADGLTGGFEAVQRLQEETGVYTDAELERIKVLFESGKAEEARKIATDAATRSYQEAADKARGPWAKAALAFEDAWTQLISALANRTGIASVVEILSELASTITLVIRKANELSGTEFFKWYVGNLGNKERPSAILARELAAERAAGGTGGAASTSPVVDPARVTAAADNRLLNETRTRVLADTEVRSRAILEQKLAQFRKDIEREISQSNPTASPAARAQAVNLRVTQERTKLEKQLADYQEQQANAAERQRKEKEEAAKKAREPIDAQEDLNARLDREAATRARIAANERAKFGLTGEALVAEERRQAIAEAVRVEEERLLELNRNRAQEGKQALTIDKARLQTITETAAAEFDARNAARVANERRQQVDQEVADLTALRDGLEQRIAQLEQQGQTGAAQALRTRLIEVNGELQKAVDAAIKWYREIDPLNNAYGLTAEQIEKIISGLEAAKEQTREFQIVAGVTSTQLGQVFSSQAVNAIDQWAQAVANGERVFDSLGEAFLSFASNFLRQIAQMILQALIFQAAMRVINGFGMGGGIGGASFPGISAGGGTIFLPGNHTGGLAGQGQRLYRPGVNPAIFANAARYHTGGIAGLKPNEVPSVLERGEEILTTDDPRHINNGGGARPVTVINALDASDVMSKALSTPDGEQAVLNFIRVNSGAVNGALGR